MREIAGSAHGRVISTDARPARAGRRDLDGHGTRPPHHVLVEPGCRALLHTRGRDDGDGWGGAAFCRVTDGRERCSEHP